VSVGCGSSAPNAGNDNAPLFRVYVEENAPITQATAEAIPASFKFTDVTPEGIFFHLIDRGPETSPVVGRDTFKRLLRWPGEGDEP